MCVSQKVFAPHRPGFVFHCLSAAIGPLVAHLLCPGSFLPFPLSARIITPPPVSFHIPVSRPVNDHIRPPLAPVAPPAASMSAAGSFPVLLFLIRPPSCVPTPPPLPLPCHGGQGPLARVIRIPLHAMSHSHAMSFCPPPRVRFSPFPTPGPLAAARARSPLLSPSVVSHCVSFATVNRLLLLVPSLSLKCFFRDPLRDCVFLVFVLSLNGPRFYPHSIFSFLHHALAIRLPFSPLPRSVNHSSPSPPSPPRRLFTCTPPGGCQLGTAGEPHSPPGTSSAAPPSNPECLARTYSTQIVVPVAGTCS